MHPVESIEFTEFEWDEVKRQRVLADREIDFLQIAEALLSPHLEKPSDKRERSAHLQSA
jgi:uncharacterized DUF497 family protein